MPETKENVRLLDLLTKSGVILSRTYRVYRGRRRIEPQDVGLDHVDDRVFSLGHGKLLPDRALEPFKLVESQVSSLILASTFPFLDSGRFLPNPKIGPVMDRLDQLRQTFYDKLVPSFIAEYDTYKAEARQAWLRSAEELGVDPLRVQTILSTAYPSVDELRTRFRFEYHLLSISLPEEVTVEELSLQNVKEVMEARNRAAVEARTKITSGVESFIAESVQALRTQAAEVCEEALKTMKTGQTGVHQRTLNRVLKMIDNIKELNWVGDDRLEAELERIRTDFLQTTAETYRNDEDAAERLKGALRGFSQSVREGIEADAQQVLRSFGAVGTRSLRIIQPDAGQAAV